MSDLWLTDKELLAYCRKIIDSYDESGIFTVAFVPTIVHKRLCELSELWLLAHGEKDSGSK
jgi:hypothetical protein